MKKIFNGENPKNLHKRTYLQPISIGIACAVFIGLILIMGIMDLRRSERSLTGLLESQGLALIEVIQKLTQENLTLLVQAHKGESDITYAPLRSESLFPQTWLTTPLADLGREVDNKWKSHLLSNDSLKAFAAANRLWRIFVMNRQGQVVFQNYPLPTNILPKDYLHLGNSSKITFGLLAELQRQKKINFIALQRKDGSGTVVIALDREGLIYWGLKVAVTKAIEKLGEGQTHGLAYIVILNAKGMILGHSGRQPEQRKGNDILTADILSGKKKIESRKVIYLKQHILDMAAPLYINGQIAGIARLGLDEGSTDSILKENMNNLIFFMVFVVLITLLSMVFLYHNQNKHLAGIVEIERRLEKAERLSALGQLAAGVAHEIRNPLNAISMASQRLKREFMPSAEEKNREFQLVSSVIRDEIRRLNGIIEEFLSFSKSRKLELNKYSVTEVLQKIVNLLKEEALDKGITLKTAWGIEPIIIPMDMDKLQQALLNFVKNAMESINGNGVIILNVMKYDKDHISISISDTGCGMDNEEIERIFNPEYTTKEKGLGLGLALAHEIIRGHGGEILVFSTIGKGTTFEIRMPSEHPTMRTNGNPSRD